MTQQDRPYRAIGDLYRRPAPSSALTPFGGAAKAEPRKRAARCSPHAWRMPKAGDDNLECEACGRRLNFVADVTPNMRASIVNAYEKHRGPELGAAFRNAFNAAFEDAKRRRST